MQSLKHRFLCALFLLFLCPFVFHSHANAQVRPDGGREDRARISLHDLETSPFYYIDAFNLEIGLVQPPQEGLIDQETYVLGPGDILSVAFEGGLSGTFRAIRVNPQGDIILPNTGIGAMRVEGLTLARTIERVNEQVSNHFIDTRVSLSLDHARPVTIHVTGDVPYPGKLTVNALTRLDQAILQAFFDTPAGEEEEMVLPRFDTSFLNQRLYAFRNIRIQGKNGNNQSADLIAYFKGGDIEANPLVRDGDVITINRMRSHSPTVSISGAVNTAEVLEFRSGDSLSDLLRIANGYSHDADQSRAVVWRNNGDEIERIELETNPDEFDRFNIRPNDRIVIPVDRTLQQNKTAWVYGEAASPGNFPILDGRTTALDLVEMAGGPTSRALSHAAYLVRTNPSVSDFSATRGFNAELLKRTSDQLLQGFEYLDLEVALNQNQIFLDLYDDEQLEGILVYHGDELHIPTDDNTIFLMGQVKNPGYYPYDSRLSVDDYIHRAGNLALAADPERIFIMKSGSRSWYRPSDTALGSGDIIFVDRVPYDELQASRTYDLQVRSQRNSNIQLVMTGLATITSIITTYVAITR